MFRYTQPQTTLKMPIHMAVFPNLNALSKRMENRHKNQDPASLLRATSSLTTILIRSTYKKSIKPDIIQMLRRKRKSLKPKLMINFRIRSQKGHTVSMM